MASISSESYDGRYFKFTVTQSGTSTTVNWTFEVLGGDDNYYTASPITCSIGNTDVYKISSVTSYADKVFPAAEGKKSSTFDVGSYGSVTIKLSGRPYYHDAGETKTATLTLTKPTYTITYNANGGSGAPSNSTKTYGTTLTLSSNKPSRDGYTFEKWNTKSDGSGTSYSSGGSYTANSGTTLYAIWKENTMTVYYCGNGADYGTYKGVPVDLNDVVHTDEYLYDNSYTTGLSNVQNKDYLYLSRTGYTSTGYWLTAGTGDNITSVHQDDTSLNSGEAVAQAFGMTLKNVSQGVRVYAQWQINNYTINYNPSGGYGNIDSHVVQWLQTFEYSKNTFVREGYKFIGWNLYRNNDDKWYVEYQGWLTEDEILANGYSKKVYKDKETMTLDNSWINDNDEAREFTLYALWEISGVTYIDNGSVFEPYLAYIDNGTEWDLYIMYVDDGLNWNIIS